MNEWEASEKRISCRSYQDRLIEPETVEKLRACIKALNEESGLKFQLFTSEAQGKPAIKMAGAMFSGPVYTFAALPGGDDPLSAERVGYYGEKLVIYATQLGLGTCWVAGTYDPKSISVDLAPGEKVWDVIPMGYATEKIPLKQGMVRKTLRKRDRRPEEVLESDVPYAEVPEWVKIGVKALIMGPSAVNQQPVNIVYKEGRVCARVWKDGHGLQHNDLGIAKRQFEIGAAYAGVEGRFAEGDGGEFLREE